MMDTVQRRTFLKAGAAVAAVSAMPLPAMSEPEGSVVVVVHGTDIPKMVEAGMEKLGGWSSLFKAGMKIAIKPNVAWKSTPEQGGNTHPDLIKSFVLAAEKMKVKSIEIPENTCQPERETFPTSGVEAALEGTSAHLYRPKPRDYRKVDLPKGVICKTAEVPKALLDADCVINMPVAKHHSGATLTLSMKNWMGAVSNKTRRGWHRDGLHQCIADFSTFLKPTLIVIDATRIMLDHGPQGPGKLAHPHEIILSKDPVAADAYATTLFKKKPEEILHIQLAAKAGVGCADLSKVKIVRVEV